MKEQDKHYYIAKWNLESLKDPYVVDNFNQCVIERLRMNEKVEARRVNESWIELKTAVINSAQQNLGDEWRREAHKSWVSEGMLQNMEQRNLWKNVHTVEEEKNTGCSTFTFGEN